MGVERWTPKQELTEEEQHMLLRMKRTGKLFAFLRRHRPEPRVLAAALGVIPAEGGMTMRIKPFGVLEGSTGGMPGIQAARASTGAPVMTRLSPRRR